MAKLTLKETKISKLFVIEAMPASDERGSFSRLFCKNELTSIGFNKELVNINHSRTLEAGTIRGLHFQLKPYAEIKIVRCTKGKIFDVAVDLRKNSSTFLQWFGIELSQTNGTMVYIPEGFAHGFQALENDSEIIYFNTEFYQKDFERGLLYSDERLKIDWPLEARLVSPKDKANPKIEAGFEGFSF